MVSRSAQKSAMLEEDLTQELDSLKRLLPCDQAQALRVRWTPNPDSKLSGEVIGNTIFIYDESECAATSTLRHEYLDYLLTKKLIQPLIAIINMLIQQRTEEIYEEKERAIDMLLKIL